MRFLNPLSRCVCSHLLCSLCRLSRCLVSRPQLSSQQCKLRLARMNISSVQAPSMGQRSKGRGSPVLHTQRALVHLPPRPLGLNRRVGGFCVWETEAMGGAGWRMNVQALFLLIYTSHCESCFEYIRGLLNFDEFTLKSFSHVPAALRSHMSSSYFKCYLASKALLASFLHAVRTQETGCNAKRARHGHEPVSSLSLN